MTTRIDHEGRTIVVPDEGLEELLIRQFMATFAEDAEDVGNILSSDHAGNGIYEHPLDPHDRFALRHITEDGMGRFVLLICGENNVRSLE